MGHSVTFVLAGQIVSQCDTPLRGVLGECGPCGCVDGGVGARMAEWGPAMGVQFARWYLLGIVPGRARAG